MPDLEYKQNAHLNPALFDPSSRTLNAGNLTGRWVNTDPGTLGLAEVLIEQDGATFTVGATGVGEDGPIAWPKTAARTFANLEEEAGQRALALALTYVFDFMTVETYFRVNKGVLVVVLFCTFRDGSGRSNYVNREFFYRSH